MRTVVCTAGTSVARGLSPLENTRSAEDYRRAIRERLASLAGDRPEPSGLLRSASAESNSLHSLELDHRDHVVLLSSETEDGKICAGEVARLLERSLQLDVEVRGIEGLQVTDAERFRRVGVQNLFAALSDCAGPALDDPARRVLLNATGGFKSAVPYLTLFGLLHRIPVVYLFELSDTLITLPPAPIHYDYERLSRATGALARLQVEGAMERERFFEAIPHLAYGERDWFETLLEEDEGLVTLSAFGHLLAETLEREEAQVLLSPSARRSYEKAEGKPKEQLDFLLERVRNPLWRRAKRHAFTGSDLRVYKPGNTPERIACIVRGTRVYVCEIFTSHDEYERDLPRRKTADYDLSTFAMWQRAPAAPEPPSTEEEQYRRQVERADELEACWRRAEEQLAGARRELEKKQRHADEAFERIESLEEECRQLHAWLERARRPWWKRLLDHG